MISVIFFAHAAQAEYTILGNLIIVFYTQKFHTNLDYARISPKFFVKPTNIFKWNSFVKWKAISIFWLIFKGFLLSNSRQFHFSGLILKGFAYISIAISPLQPIPHPNHSVTKSCCFGRTSQYKSIGRDWDNFLVGEKKNIM